MMFQNYAFFHIYLDNVAFALKSYKQIIRNLKLVQMEDFADRFLLSGGQQQRVALARALITNLFCF